ncbi:winged helix-turn-helix domain-containing protein [Sphingomonas sp.]|uniref:winged helix-turn-helix domain-containing protein n=1 Tax=Sphingomonas sp. TaxID=28214 RepID=UPI000DB3B830|nr:winged helix-turn-helix domain-containing protein [Sphingomonas sp.]PZU06108.1 MAG: hypothetical protein DI605_20035 [Sphingomonas sp.]
MTLEIRPINLGETAPFRVGLIEARPAIREVVGADERETLEPRVMQVLVLLAQRAGEVVTREQMIAACWGGRIVGEDAINRTIGVIRRVAETVGQASFQVDTVVKVGYRLSESAALAAPVAEGEAAASPDVPEPPAGRRPTRRLVIGGAGVVAVGAAAWTIWRPRRADSVDQLRALGLEAARVGTAEVTARGLALVKEAASRRPDEAESWGALALARIHANYFNSGATAREEARAAQEDARHALAIDRSNVSAPAALAMALPPFGNWLASENALRAVLAHAPDQYEACVWLSRMLARVGRMRDALAALSPIERRIQNNPSVLYWQSYLMWAVGRVADGDRVIDNALRLWPRNYQIWFSRFWTYAYSGRSGKAVAMVEDASRRPPGIPAWNFDLILASARALGSKAVADINAAQAAITAAAAEGTGFKEIGVELLSALGRVDAAYAMADLYFFDGKPGDHVRYSAEQGSYSDRLRLNTRFLFTPPTTPFRADARFARLTETIGLADYWQRSGSRPDAAGILGSTNA